MRTGWDAVRSMKAYTAVVLGDAWEVKLWDEPGELLYPFARVSEVAPEVQLRRGRFTDVTQAFSLHCYPADPSVLETATDALESAHETRRALDEGFELGVGLGKGRRVPLYDYDGLTLVQASDRRNAHDFMRVADFSFTTLTDPQDERGMAVVAQVRVSYRRSRLLASSAKVVKEVRLILDAS